MSRYRFLLILISILTIFSSNQRSVDGESRVSRTTSSEQVIYLPMIFNPGWFAVTDPVIYPIFKDGYAAVGEVNNRMDSDYELTLEVSIYTPTSGTTLTETVSTWFTATLPEQHNPYRLDIPNLEPQDTIVASVKSASPILSSAYTGLTVVSQTYQYLGAGMGQLTGVVRNDSAYRVSSLRGSAWSFEVPIFFELNLSKSLLQPGETTGFSGQWYQGDPLNRAGTYQVAVQGVASP